jgi:uncharacterized protein (DUF305 family)
MTSPADLDTTPEAEAADDFPAARPRRGIYAWFAAALAFALLVGLGGGYLLTRPKTPSDTSVEAGFFRDMSTHHAQAVAMAMIAHQNSDNALIVSLAGDIATTQQAQIGYMQAWLRDWNLSPTGSQPVMAWMPGSAGSVVNGLMPGMATPDQMTALGKATGKQLDIMFLQLMRSHHLGGIHMAQEALALSQNADLDWLAQSMVQNQQGEIDVINTYLKQLGSS